MKFRFDPKFSVSVLAVVTWLCLFACGGGGSGSSDTSGGSITKELSLSTEQAFPGQPLFIGNSGTSPGELAEVVFTQDDGAEVVVLAYADKEGELLVAVPPIFNSDGDPTYLITGYLQKTVSRLHFLLDIAPHFK